MIPKMLHEWNIDLGRSIAQILPFHRIRVTIKKQLEQKEIITTKLVITMVIIAIAKIAVIIVYS